MPYVETSGLKRFPNTVDYIFCNTAHEFANFRNFFLNKENIAGNRLNALDIDLEAFHLSAKVSFKTKRMQKLYCSFYL